VKDQTRESPFQLFKPFKPLKPLPEGNRRHSNKGISRPRFGGELEKGQTPPENWVAVKFHYL